MIRAVLDANVYASALVRPEGPPGLILARCLELRDFLLVVSPPILAELRECLGYSRLRNRIAATDLEIELWLIALELIALPVEGTLDLKAVDADPDDDIYVAAAVEGLADYLVTGDAHLKELKSFHGIHIVNPREFLTMLEQQVPST